MIRSGYHNGVRGSLETSTESPDYIKCLPLTPEPTNSFQNLYLNVLGTAEKQDPVAEKCILIMFEASGCYGCTDLFKSSKQRNISLSFFTLNCLQVCLHVLFKLHKCT